ncbi:MAG: hypothetical protein ABI204_02365 [Ginsengibacter sp.]
MRFFKIEDLSTQLVILFFLFRTVVSTFYCYLIINHSISIDTRVFHQFGIEEYNLLFTNPKEYFTNLFTHYDSQSYSRFLDISHSFWNDLRSNIIIKMLSIMDIFSGKNLYINTLFFNFMVYFGMVALYKTFRNVYSQSKKAIIFCVFILPSALIFSSAIHRDGIILLALSIIIYSIHFGMKKMTFSKKKMLLIAVMLLLILLLRNYVFVLLVPSLCAWILAINKPKYTLLIFSLIFGVCVIFFFTSGYISPKIDLPKYVVERQEKFIEIGDSAHSSIKISLLKNSVQSFLAITPQAFDHAFLRPHLSDNSNKFYLPFAIEILFYEIVFILFLFFRKKNILGTPIIYFCIFFTSLMLIITGYTVPVIGAIIRYRSIYLIFLMLPILCGIDWEKIKTLYLKIYHKLF